MNKIIVIVVAAVAVGSAFFFFNRDKVSAPEEQTDRRKQYIWYTDEAGTDQASGAPKTKVSLKAGNESVREVGTYTGSCSEITATSWTLLENEKSGVICWWAGGGNEIGIFEENGKSVVKVGDLDEGTAETPGLRGNFKTVFQLP